MSAPDDLTASATGVKSGSDWDNLGRITTLAPILSSAADNA